MIDVGEVEQQDIDRILNRFDRIEEKFDKLVESFVLKAVFDVYMVGISKRLNDLEDSNKAEAVDNRGKFKDVLLYVTGCLSIILSSIYILSHFHF